MLEVILVYGIMMLLFSYVICIQYVDMVTLLLKLLPLREPKGYKDHKKIRDSIKYKQHAKTWKRKYFSFMWIHTLIYIVAILITKIIAVGFILMMMSFIFSLMIMGKREHIELKNLEEAVIREMIFTDEV